MGPSTLSDLMLDLGLFKLIWMFFPISISAGGSNPAGPYPKPFSNPAGEKLTFTHPNLPLNKRQSYYFQQSLHFTRKCTRSQVCIHNTYS